MRDCQIFASNDVTFGILTYDNGYAGLDALPTQWQGLTFDTSGCTPNTGDTFSTFILEVTTLTMTHAIGRYEIEIHGAGSRANSVLSIRGRFDTALQ